MSVSQSSRFFFNGIAGIIIDESQAAESDHVSHNTAEIAGMISQHTESSILHVISSCSYFTASSFSDDTPQLSILKAPTELKKKRQSDRALHRARSRIKIVPDNAIAFNCSLPRKIAGFVRLSSENPRVLGKFVTCKAMITKAQ